MHLQIIVGSIRQGRRAKPVSDWAYQLAAARNDLSVELVDIKDWNLPMFDLPKSPMLGHYEDARQRRWADKIAEADGYLFVSPEYNHGYTSALKNALDYLYGEWGRKPAGFISYGGGTWRTRHRAIAVGIDRAAHGTSARCFTYPQYHAEA